MSDGNRGGYGATGLALALAASAALFVATGTGAYFGALYAPSQKQYDAVSSQTGTGDTYEGVTRSLPDVAGIPGPVERAIANPQPETGQDHEKRELAAQEGMAVWAFYMALFSGLTVIVTGIGTVYIAKQVRLTQEAVRDTGDATKAMVRQNELTEAAQRPWIAVEADLSSAIIKKDVIEFAVNVRFSNRGKTVAENFYGSVALVGMSEPLLVHLKRHFDGFVRESAERTRNTAVIPGQTFTHPAQASWAIEHLPWCEAQGYRKDCFFMVLAMSQYRIPGEDGWRYSMQSFAIGEYVDHIDSYNLIYDTIREATPDSLVMKPLGMTRAT